jgi:DinB family protein
MSREEMLMHVITHGVGHRGQVSALMLLNSVTPPRDGFTTYRHDAEAMFRVSSLMAFCPAPTGSLRAAGR